MKKILSTDDPQTFLVVYRERLGNTIQTLIMECSLLWASFLMFVWNEPLNLIMVMAAILLTISLIHTGVLFGYCQARRTFDKLINTSVSVLERNRQRLFYIIHCTSQRLRGYAMVGGGVFFTAGCVALPFNGWVGMFLIPWSAIVFLRGLNFYVEDPAQPPQFTGLKLPKI